MKKKTGWTYPDRTISGKKSDIIAECLEPQPYWDDWNDHRDGMRGYDDSTKIEKRTIPYWRRNDIIRWNKKNKLLLKRRKAMKERRTNITDLQLRLL